MRGRSMLLFIAFILAFVVEMVFYALDALGLFVNFIWTLSTFVVLSLFIVFMKVRAQQKAEEDAEGLYEEAKELKKQEVEEKNKP